MEIIKCKGFDAYKIHSIWLVTEYKNNCVFKTRFIGHAFRDVIVSETTRNLASIPHIVLSSISTKISNCDEFEIKILSKDEILNIVNKCKVTRR